MTSQPIASLDVLCVLVLVSERADKSTGPGLQHLRDTAMERRPDDRHSLLDITRLPAYVLPAMWRGKACSYTSLLEHSVGYPYNR